MGLPWPPPYSEGNQCARCDAVIFDNRTPAFIYAFGQDIVRCGYTPPGAPDPNRVVRMFQSILEPCFWSTGLIEGPWDYSWGLTFNRFGSFMRILDISGMWIFRHDAAGQCIDSFTNQLVCGAPIFPGFEGGILNCFW